MSTLSVPTRAVHPAFGNILSEFTRGLAHRPAAYPAVPTPEQVEAERAEIALDDVDAEMGKVDPEELAAMDVIATVRNYQARYGVAETISLIRGLGLTTE